jgi:mannose-6-phosphate isomerase-like protein (cupin superfamily)
MNEVEQIDRGNHLVYPLLNQAHGLTGGATAMAADYTDTEFVITGTHDDQEIFYVIDGSGEALVGEEVIPIQPGSCFLVPPHTVHGIRRDDSCEAVRAFFVHAAP